MENEDRILKYVVKKLISNLNVKAVILFGSRARGDWTLWSDYDLLIIADFSEKYIDRIKKVLEIIGDAPLDIEPHPYTLQEAIEMLKKGNPIIVDALEEGKILYLTEEVSTLINTFKELKKRGLRRTETTIIVPRLD